MRRLAAILALLLWPGLLFGQSTDLYALRAKLIAEGKVISSAVTYSPLPATYDAGGNLIIPAG